MSATEASVLEAINSHYGKPGYVTRLRRFQFHEYPWPSIQINRGLEDKIEPRSSRNVPRSTRIQLDGIEIVGEAENLQNPPLRTNDVLTYFGFPDGIERNELLMKYGNTHQEGIAVLRAATHLAMFYGIAGEYERTSPNTRGIIGNIAGLIKRHGTPNADYIISTEGLMRLDEVLKSSEKEPGKWTVM